MQMALYREHAGADWTEVEIIGRHATGKLVLREVGGLFPGVFLASLDAVRVPVVGLRGVALLELVA
jgi:hypothetical protein